MIFLASGSCLHQRFIILSHSNGIFFHLGCLDLRISNQGIWRKITSLNCLIYLTTHHHKNFRDFTQIKTFMICWIWNDILNLVIFNPHNPNHSIKLINKKKKMSFHTLFKSFKLSLQSNPSIETPIQTNQYCYWFQ